MLEFNASGTCLTKRVDIRHGCRIYLRIELARHCQEGGFPKEVLAVVGQPLWVLDQPIGVLDTFLHCGELLLEVHQLLHCLLLLRTQRLCSAQLTVPAEIQSTSLGSL